MADSNLLQGGLFHTTKQPTVDAGGPYSGTQNTAIALDSTVTVGTDASPTLLWTEVTSNGGVFSNNAIADPTFTPDTNGSYTLRLTVTPNDGSPVFDDATLTSTIVVAPTVDAGGPYSGDVDTAIALDGTVTPGTDATPTLLWTEPSALGGTFSNTAIEDPTFTPTSAGAYTLRLSADPTIGAPVTDDAALTSNAAISTATGAVTGQAAVAAGNVLVYANVTSTGAVTGQAAVTTGQSSVDTNGVLITLTLVNESGTPLANLSNLQWAFFDQALPSTMLAPVDQGTNEATDGSGVLQVRALNSLLTPGQTGYFIVSDTDGTEGQSPAQQAFAGPVGTT